MQEAFDLRYVGDDIEGFFREAEKLYEDAGFTDLVPHGMVMKAIKTDQKMMVFVLIRGNNTFEKVKRSCLNYEGNQKLHDLGCSSSDTKRQQRKNDTTMEQLCEQMKTMQLIMAKLEKNCTKIN